MKLLVTGGTGFLGFEFLQSQHLNHQIYASYRTNPGKNFENVTWIKLDLTDQSHFHDVYEQLKDQGIDSVVHIGGSTPNRAYADGHFDATIEGTRYLIDLTKKLGARKIIFVSSISADFPHKGPYSESKRIAERDLQVSGLNYTIFRPETIIGPNAKDFNRVAKILQKKKFFPILGSGKNISQPIASSDLIKMMVSSLENKITDNKNYPAVGKDKITTREFLKKIAQTGDNKIRLIPIPLFLAKAIAAVANKINPKWGLNNERVSIMSHSREYELDHMEDFDIVLTSFDEMISFLIKSRDESHRSLRDSENSDSEQNTSQSHD